MDDLVHQLLDAFIPRPVFYILARFSNLIYRLFFGLYNDPTSWKSTLLPPLIALLAGYLALLTVYRTVQSTARLVWWSVKWGVILGAVFGGYAWWTSEAGTINSTGQPSSGFWSGVGSVANGAARGEC
ncbi:hypothetical protein K437DRAFT_154960 [Tilletiaria anomala UBC 951]|uniref:Uncharacterized protein n=1 Tax=Tilletiaria anomala (strain ATCC 24038 / CBS 436.72 / UBC 951) TaxID=1037660 RepID=A0A066VS43_TILAU|nr:uncharacterized protein K437DRAFT_154960 [Tilletiaria anomala UBC 951]KDN43103.1 hypothetical protein K437DRAFT_154960 [Tilletiaria anomala UBC 951]